MRMPQEENRSPNLMGEMYVHPSMDDDVRREFGSDLLAGISIITSVLLGEYLAGFLVGLNPTTLSPAAK